MGGGGEWRSEAFVKTQFFFFFFFFFFWGGGGRVRGSDLGGVSGWMGTENWSFCENSKKKKIGGVWSGGGGVGLTGGVGLGGQGGCERRSKVLVKIQQQKNFEGGVGVGWGSGGCPIRCCGGGGGVAWFGVGG